MLDVRHIGLCFVSEPAFVAEVDVFRDIVGGFMGINGHMDGCVSVVSCVGKRI